MPRPAFTTPKRHGIFVRFPAFFRVRDSSEPRLDHEPHERPLDRRATSIRVTPPRKRRPGNAARDTPRPPRQICELIQSFSRLFGSAPTWVEAGLPSLKMISVGMPRTA
jgi:hypothetical protein